MAKPSIRVMAGLAALFALATGARASQPAYTNHAGEAVSGVVLAVVRGRATISNLVSHEVVACPVSIFAPPERRRLLADAGQPEVPEAVRLTVEGYRKRIARSRGRAEKGLCTREEAENHCADATADLTRHLDLQRRQGVILREEETALLARAGLASRKSD